MSNPWNTTPADLALGPFHHLLHSFETSSVQQHDHNNNNTNHPGSIVAKLREADRLIRAKRELEFQKKAIEVRPEIKQYLELEKQLTVMFNDLSDQLENIQQAPNTIPSSSASESSSNHDLLRQAYLRVFHTSQVVWDDISHENKAKLVYCIRHAIKAIFHQIQLRSKDEISFATHQKIVSELIERTNIFDELKEFDDFHLEDLYDLLTECCNSLELIKRYQQPLKLNKMMSPNSKSTDSVGRDFPSVSPSATTPEKTTPTNAMSVNNTPASKSNNKKQHSQE